MKIAFITPEYVTEDNYAGGLANYLGRVAVALVNHGHEVHVFTKSYEANEKIMHEGVVVHRVIPLWDRRMVMDRADRLVPRSLYNPYQDIKAAWCLWRRWKITNKKNAFDLTQLTNVLAVGIFFLNKKNSATVVLRLSSFRPMWDSMAGIPINIGVKARWAMEKLCIKRAEFMYAPSQFVARLTEDHYRVEKVDVIETPFFNESKDPVIGLLPEELKNKKYILFFGRMTMMKGAHILADACIELLEEHSDLHLVYIGNDAISPDNGSMKSYIKKRLNNNSRLLLLDSMKHDSLYAAIKYSDLVAIPSLIDNLPNTCLEAMSIGSIVVATKGSCFEQLIENNVSGILCDAGDSESLAAALSNVISLDDNKKQIILKKAKERIDRLSPSIKIPELIGYYRDIISTNRT